MISIVTPTAVFISSFLAAAACLFASFASCLILFAARATSLRSRSAVSPSQCVHALLVSPSQCVHALLISPSQCVQQIQIRLRQQTSTTNMSNTYRFFQLLRRRFLMLLSWFLCFILVCCLPQLSFLTNLSLFMVH